MRSRFRSGHARINRLFGKIKKYSSAARSLPSSGKRPNEPQRGDQGTNGQRHRRYHVSG
jgi:hypothetical protein